MEVLLRSVREGHSIAFRISRDIPANIQQTDPKQAGAINEQVSISSAGRTETGTPSCTSDIHASLLSLGPLKKDDGWISSFSLFSCCGPFQRDSLDHSLLLSLKKCYRKIFSNVEESSVTVNFGKYAACRFSGDRFGSLKSGKDQSSFILARWCTLGGKIDCFGSDLRPGVIDYFMKQNIVVNGRYVQCIIAAVSWFQPHSASMVQRLV